MSFFPSAILPFNPHLPILAAASVAHESNATSYVPGGKNPAAVPGTLGIHQTG
jgi:hypothetical protein